jgi:hypothetical protein
MPSSRIVRPLLVLALLLFPLAAQAAPAPVKPRTSLVITLRDFLGDLGATLTAWIGEEGAVTDPFGNRLAAPPPPETSGFAAAENRGTTRLK